MAHHFLWKNTLIFKCCKHGRILEFESIWRDQRCLCVPFKTVKLFISAFWWFLSRVLFNFAPKLGVLVYVVLYTKYDRKGFIDAIAVLEESITEVDESSSGLLHYLLMFSFLIPSYFQIPLFPCQWCDRLSQSSHPHYSSHNVCDHVLKFFDVM